MVSVYEEVGIGKFLLYLCDEIRQDLVSIGNRRKVAPRQRWFDRIEVGGMLEVRNIEGLVARHGYD